MKGGLAKFKSTQQEDLHDYHYRDRKNHKPDIWHKHGLQALVVEVWAAAHCAIHTIYLSSVELKEAVTNVKE